jgi:hypothetical protein
VIFYAEMWVARDLIDLFIHPERKLYPNHSRSGDLFFGIVCDRTPDAVARVREYSFD